RQDCTHGFVLSNSRNHLLGELELLLRLVVVHENLVRGIEDRVSGEISFNTDGLNNLDPLLVIPRLKRPSKDALAFGVILHRLRAEQEELFNRDLNYSGPSVGPGNILPNSLDAALIIDNPFPNRLLCS